MADDVIDVSITLFHFITSYIESTYSQDLSLIIPLLLLLYIISKKLLFFKKAKNTAQFFGVYFIWLQPLQKKPLSSRNWSFAQSFIIFAGFSGIFYLPQLNVLIVLNVEEYHFEKTLSNVVSPFSWYSQIDIDTSRNLWSKWQHIKFEPTPHPLTNNRSFQDLQYMQIHYFTMVWTWAHHWKRRWRFSDELVQQPS